MASSAFCGLGQVYYDDQPGPGNANNIYAQYSRVDQGCWTATASAHEIGHNLGAVQNSAPNATGASHCRDDYDVMCYPDGGPGGPITPLPCPDVTGEDRLDCRADDYFALAPPAGSYLASRWNTANAAALSTSSGPTSSTTAPPPTTVPPPTTSTTTGTVATTTALTVPSTIRSGVAITGGASRPTVRAEYGGSATCAVSSDSARPRLK